MNNIIIRKVSLSDTQRILDIYSYYIKNTAITFEYKVPSFTDFQNRIKTISKNYPYLVIVQDNIVQGYAYANSFINRAAYDWSCETTIYLDTSVQKCGLGKKLYKALEAELKKMGILNLYACIAYPNTDDEYLTRNSVDFHSHYGFKKSGQFNKCGYKFGHWYDMVYMEKIIGKHTANQPQVAFKNKGSIINVGVINK